MWTPAMCWLSFSAAQRIAKNKGRFNTACLWVCVWERLNVCVAIGFDSAGNSTEVLYDDSAVSVLSTIRIESLWRFRLRQLTAIYNKSMILYLHSIWSIAKGLTVCGGVCGGKAKVNFGKINCSTKLKYYWIRKRFSKSVLNAHKP